MSTGKKGRVPVMVRLDPAVRESLLVMRDRTGRSVSSLVEQAVRDMMRRDRLYEVAEDLGERADRLGETARDFERAVRGFGEVLRDLIREIEELRRWVRAGVFFSALATELMKFRVFTFLPDGEFEKYKRRWMRAHEAADLRVEALTGERAWRRGRVLFDPEVSPLSGEDGGKGGEAR